MTLNPGSTAWLLRHELRLSWYGMAGANTRRPGTAAIVAFALVWLSLHGVGWVVVGKLGPAPGSDPAMLLAATALIAATSAFMLSTAIKSSVLALFERGDLDLLLSSPLSSRSIFTVRLGGVVAATAGIYLFFLAPFAHAGLLLGQWRWLGVFPTVIGIAVLCTCCAMLLTLGLVRVLGARRTRVVAQVIGVLAGAALVIASQLFSVFERQWRGSGGIDVARMLETQPWLAPDSLLWLPARALLGEPGPVFALGVLAALAFAMTAQRTHRFFAHGLQQAASTAHAAAPSATPHRPPRLHFGRSLFETVVIKEWRLIARDPHLISQVLLQVIYLLPLCFVIFGQEGLHVPAIGAGLTLLASSLTGALAWIALSAEDAPDLLQLAPAAPRTVRLAKLAAAVMPVLLLVGAPLLWLVVRSPLAGLMVCFTATSAVLGAGLIVFWCGRPGLRSNFKGRGKGGFVMNLLELVNSLAWGGLGWLLADAAQSTPSDMAMLGAGAAFAVAMLTLAAAWLMRQKRPGPV